MDQQPHFQPVQRHSALASEAVGVRLLSPREVATAIGVSESSLKRWVDEGLIRAARTAGNHRRIPLAEAVRFIRDTGTPILRPEVLGLGDMSRISPEVRPQAEGSDLLFEYLTNGWSAPARGLILHWYLGGKSIAAIADGPLRGAIVRIGNLWRHDPQGVFIEHRATDICIQAITQIRLLIEIADDSPVAVGGAPSGDPYLLPSMLVATVLAEMGYRAINLGANTPSESLTHAVAHHQAAICWLSISRVGVPDLLRATVYDLSTRLEPIGVPLIVGGRDVDLLQLEATPNLLIGESMAALTKFVRAKQ